MFYHFFYKGSDGTAAAQRRNGEALSEAPPFYNIPLLLQARESPDLGLAV